MTIAYCERLCSGTLQSLAMDSVLTFIVKLCTPDDSLEQQLLPIPTVLHVKGNDTIPCIVLMCEEIVRTTAIESDCWYRVWSAMKCLQHLR